MSKFWHVLKTSFNKRRSRRRNRQIYSDYLPNPIPKLSDRNGFAVVVIVKDEARHMAEWIAFYGSMGARHIYIYDNNSQDDLDGAIRRSGFADRTTKILWGDVHKFRQQVAYNHCLATYGAQYRWMGFFDADEFVLPKMDPDLDEALSRFADQPCIALPWFMFGTSGQKEPPASLVLESYTQRAPFPPEGAHKILLNCKVFVDPTEVAAMNIHEAAFRSFPDLLFNDRGESFPASMKKHGGNLTNDVFQLNHYYTRSESEFSTKLEKGDASTVGRDRNASLWERYRAIHETVVEDDLALKFVPQIKKHLDNNAGH